MNELIKPNFTGKHAHICNEIWNAKTDNALRFIHEFFASEDNTDSYSIELLTITREFLEEDAFSTLDALNIRINKNADKTLPYIVQLIYALEHCTSYDDAVKKLSDKLLLELPRLIKSMKNLLEDEGPSNNTTILGHALREPLQLFANFLQYKKLDEEEFSVRHKKLTLTKLFLPSYAEAITNDTVELASAALRQENTDDALEILDQLLADYDAFILNTLADNSAKENPETQNTLINIQKALEIMESIEHNQETQAKLNEIKLFLSNGE